VSALHFEHVQELGFIDFCLILYLHDSEK